MNQLIIKLFMWMLCLGTFSTYSQVRTLPNRLVYNFTRHNETIKLQLIYNDSVSVSTSNKTGYDSSFSSKTAMNVNSTTGISIKLNIYDSTGNIILRNFRNQTILYREPKIAYLDSFWVQDDWVAIDWQLLDKTKKINGYDCKLAKGTFRGREYTAWYAPALSYPYGPWKLFGLPGIILEAQDKKKQFHFVVDTMTYISETASEFTPYIDSIISLKDYVYYLDNKVEFHQIKANEKASERGFSVGKMYSSTPLNIIRENSLERLYEWETKIPTDDSPKPPNVDNKHKFIDDNKHAPKSPQQQVIINNELR